MARIRTIKPEFPQSESLSRCSRDARLLFISLFTLVDDLGRTRAASRMLAGLLFPYDDDAITLIEDWLGELEQEGCIRRYKVGGTIYLDIPKWTDHQYVDRPKPSRFPEFSEATRYSRDTNAIQSREDRASDANESRDDRDDHAQNSVGRDLGREGKGRDQGREGIGTDASADALTAHPSPKPDDPEFLEQAVAAWNDLADHAKLPKCQKLTEQRKSALRARLRDAGGISGWHVAMEIIGKSSFLTGGNRDGWRADFDFVLQQKSFTKLMEGGFDDRGKKSKPKDSYRAAREGLAEHFGDGGRENPEQEFGDGPGGDVELFAGGRSLPKLPGRTGSH